MNHSSRMQTTASAEETTIPQALHTAPTGHKGRDWLQDLDQRQTQALVGKGGSGTRQRPDLTRGAAVRGRSWEVWERITHARLPEVWGPCLRPPLPCGKTESQSSLWTPRPWTHPFPLRASVSPTAAGFSGLFPGYALTRPHLPAQPTRHTGLPG